MEDETNGQIATLLAALSLRDEPAYRGELAQILDWSAETLREVLGRGIDAERLYATGDDRIRAADEQSARSAFESLDLQRQEDLRERWRRLQEFRMAAFERITQTQRVGIGLVFEDGRHIVPNRILTRHVSDWASPERWYEQLSERKRFPEPKGCPVCGEPEQVGDILVELEAPNGHEKTYAVTFHGHSHWPGDAPEAEPATLVAIRLREDRLPSPAAHPVMSGSTSDTGLNAVASYPGWGRMSEEDGPGSASLDALSEAVEEVRTRLQSATEYVESDVEDQHLQGELAGLVRNVNRIRSRVDYVRHSRRLGSTLQTLKSIFRSTWTFERIGERTVGALSSVVDADQILLLIHKSDETYEVLGRSSDRYEIPGELSLEESDLLRTLVEGDEPRRFSNVRAKTKGADDPLAVGRSWLGVPAKNGASSVGAVVLIDEDRSQFMQPDEELLHALSNAIGEALANVGGARAPHPRSGIDEVTGVFNQEQFFENASQEFVRARSEDTDLSALILEIDGWDRIAGATGGAAPDEVLRAVVDRATDALRGSDFVGRYGQATFAALLVDVDRSIAGKVAERIRSAVEEDSIELADANIPVTVSVGGATLTETIRSIDALLDRADSAMLRAAERGGNEVELAHATDTDEE